MANAPTSNVKAGAGFIGLFDTFTCFIRGRMLITRLLGVITKDEYEVVKDDGVTGRDKELSSST
jgi:hypothetical protein